jgi:hypothetical protein
LRLGNVEESQQKKGDDVEIGLLSKDQKKTPEKLMTSCNDVRWDDDQEGLPADKDVTMGTVVVETELLKTPPEQLLTHRTYVPQDDVSDTFHHDGNNVGNAFGNIVLDVNNRKRPPEELVASPTTDQVVMSFVPSLPPMMILPNPDQQDALQGIWICHNCDAHYLAKKKRCGNCKSGDLERGTL